MNRGQLLFVVLILVGLPICALELSTAHLSTPERQCSLREWPLHCLYGGHDAPNPPSRPLSCHLRLRGGGFHKGRKIRKLNNWKPKHKQVGENPLQVQQRVLSPSASHAQASFSAHASGCGTLEYVTLV